MGYHLKRGPGAAVAGIADPCRRRGRAKGRQASLVALLALFTIAAPAHAGQRHKHHHHTTQAVARPAQTSTLINEAFSAPDGNYTTMSAFWGRSDLGYAENPTWFAESGNMYRRSGTGSAKEGTFRIWTRRKDLGNIKVEMDLKLSLNAMRGSTAGWDGVKFWLRRKLQTPGPGGRVDDGGTTGYTAEVALRDGRVYIQKKVGNTYYLLSATPTAAFPMGTWTRVGGVARTNADGSVTIQVLRAGRVLVEVTDRGQKGGAPLRSPGRIGLRADNATFSVDNLAVTPIG